MPNYKNTLVVNKENEKRFYRICMELTKQGETVIETNGRKEWNGTFRKWGIRAKPLVENKLLEPIWTTYNKKNLEKRLIRIPKNVDIEVKEGNNTTIFRFYRSNY